MLSYTLNNLGFVDQISLDGEVFSVTSLCDENINTEELNPFILWIPKIIEYIEEKDLDIVNREVSRFGIKKFNNIDDLRTFSKKIDIAFSYLIYQYISFIKESIGFPYQKNFLFLSEILEKIFFLIKKSVESSQGYTLSLKTQNNYFKVLNTSAGLFEVKHYRKVKIAIEKYNINFENYDFIYLNNDVIICITDEDIKNVDIKTVLNYFVRPNFLLNTIELLGIKNKEVESLVNNYNLPLFLTDIFDIIPLEKN